MKHLRLLLIPFVLLTAVACEEDEKEGCMDPISLNYDPGAEKDNGTCQYAGTGGNTELVFFPKQDDTEIISTNSYRDTAHLKFNATVFPGEDTALYDMVFAGVVGNNHISFLNMKPGKYFIYMTGWNYTTYKRVTGVKAVSVSQSSGTVNIDVPME